MAIVFDEVQFDPKILSYGVDGGPSYRSTIIESDSGDVRVYAHRAATLHEWTFSVKDANIPQTAYLQNFWRARKGPARGFRWKDWSDYKVTDELLVNSGTAFLQLIKTYGDAYNSETRQIKKPVVGTVTMKKNGAAFVAFTLDYTTGIITLTGGAQAGTFTWSGQFDTPVRFAMDKLPTNISECVNRDFDNIMVKEILIP